MVIKTKKKKADKLKKEKRILNGKLFLLAFVSTILFAGLVIRISYIQFVKGEEYSSAAYKQQMKNKIINPKRGTIYDSNGEVLAHSVSVDTISLNPGKVCYRNKKTVPADVLAEGLTNIFGLDYNETLEKVDSKKNVVVIARRVERDKVTELENWMKENEITTGINIDEDSKRYYPYSKLASNLIGFCGSDNVGLWGLEERWNDVLTGTSGKIVTAKDGRGGVISDENEQYVAVENGNNIYLTIDTKIQGIAEKYLEQAVQENNCSRGGNVIIMNPQSGDILAMATYPNYNLNDPFSIEPTGVPQEEWDTLTR